MVSVHKSIATYALLETREEKMCYKKVSYIFRINSLAVICIYGGRKSIKKHKMLLILCISENISPHLEKDIWLPCVTYKNHFPPLSEMFRFRDFAFNLHV